jgi:hypothetical protein
VVGRHIELAKFKLASFNLASAVWRPTTLDYPTGHYTARSRIHLLYQRPPMQ